MKITNEKPPNWAQIEAEFGVDWENTIVTYGDNIHVKHTPLSADLIAHESIHVRQQTSYPGGAAAWWEKYFSDSKFRYEQEVEAYRSQVREVYVMARDRNNAARHVMKLAQDLAGPRYGNCVTQTEALKAIRS